nr:venom acid phosphatase Acph-1-like [Onthophagus taurus]
MLIKSLTFLIILQQINFISSQLPFGNETLEVVHVIFRHGDRTPDKLYKNDAYSEKSFYPFGIGELTNPGKQRSFQLGKTLRSTYGSFIGPQYTPGMVGTLASHVPRTHTALQLVLAGLFPPTNKLRWNEDLDWNPIPYNYLTMNENLVLAPDKSCPKYSKLRKQILDASWQTDPIYHKYKNIISKLQSLTGETDDIFEMGNNLFSTFKAEKDYGLPLPEWSKDFFPLALEEISKESWKYSTGIGKLKILYPGFLISNIVNNTYAKILGNPKLKRTKIFLYSGHDNNIASILFFLDSFFPHNPNYCSQIIIEVHNMVGTRFLKFMHRDDTLGVYRVIPVPNCGEYCPFIDFMQKYKNVLDTNMLRELCGK